MATAQSTSQMAGGNGEGLSYGLCIWFLVVGIIKISQAGPSYEKKIEAGACETI